MALRLCLCECCCRTRNPSSRAGGEAVRAQPYNSPQCRGTVRTHPCNGIRTHPRCFLVRTECVQVPAVPHRLRRNGGAMRDVQALHERHHPALPLRAAAAAASRRRRQLRCRCRGQQQVQRPPLDRPAILPVPGRAVGGRRDRRPGHQQEQHLDHQPLRGSASRRRGQRDNVRASLASPSPSPSPSPLSSPSPSPLRPARPPRVVHARREEMHGAVDTVLQQCSRC